VIELRIENLGEAVGVLVAAYFAVGALVALASIGPCRAIMPGVVELRRIRETQRGNGEPVAPPWCVAWAVMLVIAVVAWPRVARDAWDWWTDKAYRARIRRAVRSVRPKTGATGT
jgi:hypothetical protein